MSQSDVVSAAFQQRVNQLGPSFFLTASHCKLCHMQMAVSGAIHPQLLSVVGSDAHYGGLLPALTAAVSWWAAGAGFMFDRCSPSELANSGCRGEAFVWERCLLTWRGGGFRAAGSPTPSYCFFPFHRYSTHSPSSVTSMFFCMQVVHREDRDEEEEEEEEQEMKGEQRIKWKPHEQKTRMTN